MDPKIIRRSTVQEQLYNIMYEFTMLHSVAYNNCMVTIYFTPTYRDDDFYM